LVGDGLPGLNVANCSFIPIYKVVLAIIVVCEGGDGRSPPFEAADCHFCDIFVDFVLSLSANNRYELFHLLYNYPLQTFSKILYGPLISISPIISAQQPSSPDPTQNERNNAFADFRSLMHDS